MNYYCADHLPDLDQKYVKEALRNPYVTHHYPNDIRTWTSFGSSSFVKLLEQNLGRITALYIKNPPNSLYDWHVDRKTIRQCSINFPIISDNAYAYFRFKIENEDGKKSIMYNLDKVKYIMYKPTVLNTENEHCVINNSDNERIILSLCVIESTYQQTVDFLKTLQIEKY